MSVVNISSTFSLVVDGLLMHFTYRTVYSTFSTLSARLESLKREQYLHREYSALMTTTHCKSYACVGFLTGHCKSKLYDMLLLPRCPWKIFFAHKYNDDNLSPVSASEIMDKTVLHCS